MHFVWIFALAASLTTQAAPLKRAVTRGLLPYATYAAWTKSKRIAYAREARRALTLFERPRQFTMSADCLVGGVLRDLIPGTNICPTTGNGCAPLGDAGFACGEGYDNVCVPRLPVATLTERCDANALDHVLTEDEYTERQDNFAAVVDRCENQTFQARNAANCELFEARLVYMNSRYTGADDRQATEAVAEVVEPVTPPVQIATPIPTAPAAVCRGEPHRIFKDMGGVVGTYFIAASTLRDSQRKLEIRGACASACLLYLAQVPKARICIAPGAQLGFHQARDVRTGQVDHAFTAAMVAKYYSPELKEMWSNHYSDSTALNIVNYPELTRYYASCDSPADVCSANHQPGAESPATGQTDAAY